MPLREEQNVVSFIWLCSRSLQFQSYDAYCSTVATDVALSLSNFLARVCEKKIILQNYAVLIFFALMTSGRGNPGIDVTIILTHVSMSICSHLTWEFK
jgi:hypothetical protein